MGIVHLCCGPVGAPNFRHHVKVVAGLQLARRRVAVGGNPSESRSVHTGPARAHRCIKLSSSRTKITEFKGARSFPQEGTANCARTSTLLPAMSFGAFNDSAPQGAAWSPDPSQFAYYQQLWSMADPTSKGSIAGESSVYPLALPWTLLGTSDSAIRLFDLFWLVCKGSSLFLVLVLSPLLL